MQTYLCVVHPIYQKDEQTLQTDKEREKGREGQRTKLLLLFSLLLYKNINTEKVNKQSLLICTPTL